MTDVTKFTLKSVEKVIHLSRVDAAIFRLLLRNAGQVVSRGILSHFPTKKYEERVPNGHIGRIRRALGTQYHDRIVLRLRSKAICTNGLPSRTTSKRAPEQCGNDRDVLRHVPVRVGPLIALTNSCLSGVEQLFITSKSSPSNPISHRGVSGTSSFPSPLSVMASPGDALSNRGENTKDDPVSSHIL